MPTTPQAAGEDRPDHTVNLTVSINEAVSILQALHLLNLEPHHFDCNPHDYRELYQTVLDGLAPHMTAHDPQYLDGMNLSIPPDPRRSPPHFPHRSGQRSLVGRPHTQG